MDMRAAKVLDDVFCAPEGGGREDDAAVWPQLRCPVLQEGQEELLLEGPLVKLVDNDGVVRPGFRREERHELLHREERDASMVPARFTADAVARRVSILCAFVDPV